MIIFIGPYAPIERTSTPHLGASRKIEGVIRALSDIDKVVFINTAHNEGDVSGLFEKSEIGGVEVVEVIPKIYPSRIYGKFLNCFEVGRVVSLALSLGEVKMVWCYNAYLFENISRIILKRQLHDAIFFVEYEDSLFARLRGLNPKPFLDYLSWQISKVKIDYATAVNDKLAKELPLNKGRVFLLPGLISDEMVEECAKREPFSEERITVGYFGGLSVEKGADVILEAVSLNTAGIRFVVSGSGELEERFQERSSDEGSLNFFGRVSDAELFRLIASCDVLVNPHSPIVDMSGGVFPFKVVEAIGSSRLVVSTELPNASIPGLADGVVFFDGTPEGLNQVLVNSSKIYEKRRSVILQSSSLVCEKLSIRGLSRYVQSLLRSA